jgi:recombination protein RecA
MPLSDGEKKALSFLLKEQKLEPVDSGRPMEAFPTGSIVLDSLTGCGGLPKGRIVEISGAESSGKSTLAIAVCGVFQKRGKRPVYIDVEQTFDTGYSKKLGFELGSVSDPQGYLFQPETIEDATQVAVAFAGLETTGCLVLDSVAAARPRDELEGSDRIGLHSVKVADFVHKVVPLAGKSGCVIIGVNQNRTKIEKVGMRTNVYEDVAGGKTWKYHCTCRFGLRIVGVEKGLEFNPLTGQEEETRVSNRVRISAIKNKAGVPHRSGEVIIRYGHGIDNIATVVELAEAYGVLSKSGNGYYKYESKKNDKLNFSVRGAVELRARLDSDKDLLREIVDTLALDRILAGGVKGSVKCSGKIERVKEVEVDVADEEAV